MLSLKTLQFDRCCNISGSGARISVCIFADKQKWRLVFKVLAHVRLRSIIARSTFQMRYILSQQSTGECDRISFMHLNPSFCRDFAITINFLAGYVTGIYCVLLPLLCHPIIEGVFLRLLSTGHTIIFFAGFRSNHA